MPIRAPTYGQLLKRLRPDQPRQAVRLSEWRRGSRIERGYDAAWLKLAKLHRAQHPVCEQCEARGRVAPSTQTDHIVPFHGLDDPLRLDWENLQALCDRCHSRKTATEDGGFGRPKRQRQEQHHG